MYRFAYSMCKDEDAAKDSVQDAFVKLWERKENVDPAKVKSYLFNPVHHKIIDGFRSELKLRVMINRLKQDRLDELQEEGEEKQVDLHPL